MVDKTRCSKQVATELFNHSFSCKRKAIIEHDEKWYCWQHDPERVKKERKKAEEKMEKKWAAEKAETDLRQGDLQICREARAAGLDPVKMLKAEIDLIKCGDYREKCEGEE